MIRNFWGKNFGILKDFSVTLSPLTLLVGPNASGKSTLMRALRLLAMLTRTPLYGSGTHGARRMSSGGPMRLGYRASLEDLVPSEESRKQMTLGVSVGSPEGEGTYEISLGYIAGDKHVKVLDEKAIWNSRNGKSFKYDATTEPFEFEFRGARVSSGLPRESTLPYLCGPYRSSPDWSPKLKPLFELVSLFSPFHVYRFSPSAISRPSPTGDTMSYDGGGLAAELDRLLGEERDKFDDLVTRLIALYPHIKQVRVSTITMGKGDALKGIVFERVDGAQVPAELESDGVLLTLAYLWLLTRQEVAMGLEEPETATYPTLLESRLKLMQGISQGGLGGKPVQVLATTHSSFLLTAAQDPSIIRIFDPQSDGSVRIYQPPEEFMGDVVYKRLAWTCGGEK